MQLSVLEGRPGQNESPQDVSSQSGAVCSDTSPAGAGLWAAGTYGWGKDISEGGLSQRKSLAVTARLERGENLNPYGAKSC